MSSAAPVRAGAVAVDVDAATCARGASVMLHGRGLGAAFAAKVAARHPGVALCVERAFASLGSFVAEVAWVDFRARFAQLTEWERERSRKPSDGAPRRRAPRAIAPAHFVALHGAVALRDALRDAIAPLRACALCARAERRREARGAARGAAQRSPAERRAARSSAKRESVVAVVRLALAAAGWSIDTAAAWEGVDAPKFMVHHPLDGVIQSPSRLMDALNRRLLRAAEEEEEEDEATETGVVATADAANAAGARRCSACKERAHRARILPDHIVVLSDRVRRTGPGRRASNASRGVIAHNRLLSDGEWGDLLFAVAAALE